MAKSLAFARIRAEVMAAASAVPAGRVTTYGAIANHLEISARHVAFVMSRLGADEAKIIPWHRVIGAQGTLRQPTPSAISRQRKRLIAEGVDVSTKGEVRDFEMLVFRWEERADRPGQAVRRPYSDAATKPLFAESLRFGYPTSAEAIGGPASSRRGSSRS